MTSGRTLHLNLQRSIRPSSGGSRPPWWTHRPDRTGSTLPASRPPASPAPGIILEPHRASARPQRQAPPLLASSHGRLTTSHSAAPPRQLCPVENPTVPAPPGPVRGGLWTPASAPTRGLTQSMHQPLQCKAPSLPPPHPLSSLPSPHTHRRHSPVHQRALAKSGRDSPLLIPLASVVVRALLLLPTLRQGLRTQARCSHWRLWAPVLGPQCHSSSPTVLVSPLRQQGRLLLLPQ